MTTPKINFQIHFNAEHIKPIFYTDVPRDDFSYDDLGFTIIKGGLTYFYPWTSIYKLVRQDAV